MDKRREDSSRFGGILGPVLLLSILVVLMTGVVGAVYFDEFHWQSGTHAAQNAPAPDNFAAEHATTTPSKSAGNATIAPPPIGAAPNFAVIPPAATPETAKVLNDGIQPAAGRGAPPVQALRPAYWVEYGAYRGPSYAEALKRGLIGMGVKAEVTRAAGKGGFEYYRVRSRGEQQRDAATAEARQVAAKFGIAPLIHRGAGPPTAEVRYTSPESSHKANEDRRYWVQFAAYDLEGYAKRLIPRLRQVGIDAFVIDGRRPDGRPLFLVRSQPLKRLDEARHIAAQGEAKLGSKVLIVHTPPAERRA